MLEIEELVRFGRNLDGEYRHPVATELADRWGTAAPRFVRSSATHVLVADRRAGDRLVLRLRPAADADILRRASIAAQEWSTAGAPMVSSVRSLWDRLVETGQEYAAMALEVAEGPTLDETDDQLVDHAAQWGEALARLHAVRLTCPGLTAAPDLPLPCTPDVYGTLHGDPEADNVVLSEGGLCFVDPDEVRRGWFASDVAFALRNWSVPGRAPDLSAEVPRRFIQGYRRVRPLSDVEISWMPLLARESARTELAGHDRHLSAGPAADWPEWATRLRARIMERATALRESLATA